MTNHYSRRTNRESVRGCEVRKQKEWKDYPLRVCRTLHECCLCADTIKCGYEYYDGGYGKRAHEHCVLEEQGRIDNEKWFCPNCGDSICERCCVCSTCGYEVGE